MTDTLDGSKDADTTYPVASLLAARWSPRGLDPKFAVDDATVGSLLEAARWTPSSMNSQPWRFVVAMRGDADFDRIVGTLSGANSTWAPHAAALIVVCACIRDDDDQPLRWAEYDAGQSAAHLSIQAESMGLSVHQMGGFHADDLHATLGLPQDVVPLSIIAVGRFYAQADLPEPLAQRERAPRSRLPLADLVLNAWPRST